MTNDETQIESLETWLSKKPYWEQFVWKVNLEKDLLADEDIDQAYQYLSEHLGLIDAPVKKPAPISFKKEMLTTPEVVEAPAKIKIVEVKDFVNVNAISDDCSIKFGPDMTLIYGGNGSGKSGIGRLLCNACFSRGERNILPNVRNGSGSGNAKATFVINDGSGELQEVEYEMGDDLDELGRFSIFDSASVLIHLDESNRVNFTPAQIKIFDKVADTISKLEEKLTNERNAKRKDDPFDSMFLSDESTATATFCKSITSDTKEADLLKHVNFNKTTDGAAMKTLEKQIDEKRKLDIPKKKNQLSADRQNLAALKEILKDAAVGFTKTRAGEINKLIKEILEKQKLVEGLSVQSFNDGILKTVGSSEWKSLIFAAKELHDAEVEANDDKEPEHCVLCHQKHTKESKALFKKYWEFLESKAEGELAQLKRSQTSLIEDLRDKKSVFPKFLATDAGVKILNEEDPKYLAGLKVQYASLKEMLEDWSSKIGKLTEVSSKDVPTIDLAPIDTLISAKKTEEGKLVDPTSDIAKLTAQLNALQHKKDATAVKDAALEYLTFAKWSAKASVVNFAGIKAAITKKRTESFQVGVALNYKGVFNQELAKLGCDFNLKMNTSGDQGNTVKEYRLDFAEDYNPSEILSEGEQNACSIADFLTEAQLDKSNCGIIFDDPVTSLDHDRKDLIAKRLVEESSRRQVVVFTHDMTFMSQMVKHSERNGITPITHWIRKVNGVPGCIEENTSPKLANLNSLKKEVDEAVKDYDAKKAKEQEQALGYAFDCLRSACEALIEEKLFGKTIQRYEDHIRVQNLEEAVFDQPLALRVTALHGKISEYIPAHNRSDAQREKLPSIDDYKAIRKEFNDLEADINKKRTEVLESRGARRSSNISQKVGW